MSSGASDIVRSWISSTFDAETFDISALRTALVDADDDLGRPITDPEETVAAAFDRASGWYVFIPVDGDRVAVVSADELQLTTWDQVRADATYWLNPESRLAGLWDDPNEVPFPVDAESWSGTTLDEASGESEWSLFIDDGVYAFDLKSADLRYSTRSDASWPAGIYIDIAEGGASMSTGDIGMSVSVDDAGNIWSSIWGCEETFHGRADAAFSPYSYLPAPPAEAAALLSTVFDPQQMRELVDYVAECVPDFDDEIPIRCVGFSGTASELIAITQSTIEG